MNCDNIVDMRVRLRLSTCSVVPLATVLVLAAALLCLGWPGAARAADAAQRPLVVMLQSQPATLDPLLATDADGVRISHQLIFETFVRLGDDLTLKPGLTHWKRLSGTHYRFTLPRGRRFHDGQPLTATDAVYTLRRFMAPQVGSPYGAMLRQQIASVRKTGTYTFDVRLKKPYASFLANMVLPVLCHTPSAKPTPWGDLNGTGPFRFASRDPNEIVLDRDPHYPHPAGVAQVVFKVVQDEATRMLKFDHGDIDLGINVLPLDKIVEFGRPPLSERYRVVEAPGLSYQYLGFNLRDPVLSHLRVRQAIAHAINVPLLIARRQMGHSVPATGLMPPGSPYSDPALKPYAYDPAEAKRLLDAAGYPARDGVRFHLSYKTSTDRSAVIQARVIQSFLRQVGIAVDVRSYEWATFYSDIRKGNFQLYSLRWIGVSGPDFLYELLDSHSTPPGGRNRDGYANPKVDALLERARLESNPRQRARLYREVHRIVHADLPYLSLWHNNNVAVVARGLAGFRLDPAGGFLHLAAVHWAGH